ncbi:MAG: hypothetical protein KJ993_17075 [Actinobacteria bacterium]|nr:hypothetical protein [Actinomycetota bacterium]
MGSERRGRIGRLFGRKPTACGMNPSKEQSRSLGVPTVEDRVAQMVVLLTLQPWG